MAGKWEPKVGDDVVDYRTAARMHDRDVCGPVVQIKTITTNLIITTEGEKYSREHLTPASEGRYSSRRLVPARDDRVLCVKGRNALEHIARYARNLADLPRTDPADITAALASLVTVSDGARRGYAELLAGKDAGDE
jgi:hypothetical protein